jgi:chromosome segregation ATPase
MAGLTLLVLSLVVFVSSAEVQDQIRKLKDDIRSLQLQVENEHDFLVKYNARVEKLEKVFAEMRQERIELSEFEFLLILFLI